MRVLIVEDDPRNVTELKKAVVEKFSAGDIEIKNSRDSALAALAHETFDLIILDRKLPTIDGALDEDVAHGESVYSYIKTEVMGTPVRFWTAFPDDDYYSEKVNDLEQEDIWGSGKQPTVNIIKKSRFDEIVRQIALVRDALAAVDQVELRHRPGHDPGLKHLEKRVVKIFAKRQQCSAAEVALLSGGYSNAKVLKVALFADGRQTLLAVGKISTITNLKPQLEKHRPFNQLLPGAVPTILCQVRAGAGRIGGTFYRLAEDHDESVFKVLSTHLTSGAELVQAIRNGTKPWESVSKQQRGRISEIRQKFAEDDVLAALGAVLPDLNLREFESQEVVWQQRPCHGDLHGENALLCGELGSGQMHSIFIDVDEAGELPAPIDPITLELSCIFHRDGLTAKTGWPNANDAINWADINKYVANCPYSEFVRACREWAHDCGGNRSYYACAYGYLVRQFKYDDTDKDLIKAMIRTIVAAYKLT